VKEQTGEDNKMTEAIKKIKLTKDGTQVDTEKYRYIIGRPDYDGGIALTVFDTNNPAPTNKGTDVVISVSTYNNIVKDGDITKGVNFLIQNPEVLKHIETLKENAKNLTANHDELFKTAITDTIANEVEAGSGTIEIKDIPELTGIKKINTLITRETKEQETKEELSEQFKELNGMKYKYIKMFIDDTLVLIVASGGYYSSEQKPNYVIIISKKGDVEVRKTKGLLTIREIIKDKSIKGLGRLATSTIGEITKEYGSDSGKTLAFVKALLFDEDTIYQEKFKNYLMLLKI